MSKSTNAVYKLVDEALRADSNEIYEIAFVKYLQSISTVADTLIKEADDNRAYPNNRNVQLKNLLKIVKQCLDRVEELGETLDNNTLPPKLSPNPLTVGDLPDGKNNYADSAFSDNSIASSCISENSVLEFSSISFDSNDTDSTLFTNQPMPLTPLERVERENRQLKAAYKARLARTQNVKARIDLHLALERRLAENVVLARAQEVVLNNRRHETQRRLLEQASRIIGSSQSISSKETESRKAIYAKILIFEQQVQWPQMLRDKLKSNPRDFNHIDLTVKQTLRSPNHPLNELLRTLQYTIYDKVIHLTSRCKFRTNEFQSPLHDNSYKYWKDQSEIEPIPDVIDLDQAEIIEELQTPPLEAMEMKNEDRWSKTSDKTEIKPAKDCTKPVNLEEMEEDALRRHMHYIVVDVRYALDKLLNMFVLTYDLLNSPEAFDQCYASVEEPFFKPLWPYLLQLFRLAYKSDELAIAKLMQRSFGKSIMDLCGLENFCDTNHLENRYSEAIEELANVVNLCCPLKKLDTLVRVAHLICQDRFHQTKTIGADDLIPILCYVVLKTGSPQLVTECQAMAEFIHEGYLMGEEGYCLTSLQTVFQYLKSQAP